MVGLIAGDDLDLVRLSLHLPVEAYGLEGRFARLGASAGEEGHVQVAISDLRKAIGQLDGRYIGGAHIGRAIGQGLHLVRGGLRQLSPAMAHHHVPEARKAIDIAFSVHIVQINPFPQHKDQGLLMITGMIKGMDEMLLILLHQFRRVKCHHKRYLLSELCWSIESLEDDCPKQEHDARESSTRFWEKRAVLG